MFCRYCGNDIAGDSVFCEVCGKRLKDEQVNQAPVMQEPTQYDTNSPLYYYNAQADTKPLDQGIKREYHASKYEKMSGFSGSLPPIDSTPAPKIEYKRAPDEPIKPKKEKRGVVPYILLPIGYMISSLFSVAFQLIGVNIYDLIVNSVLFDSDFRFGSVYWSIYYLVYDIATAIPYLGILVLFSLCCKGIYKKAMFIGSTYVGSTGGILSTVFSVIAGYIILYTSGFHYYESQATFTLIMSISAFVSIIICPVFALLWFMWTQKYTVKKEEKTCPVKLILPCIFLGFYGILALGLQLLSNLAIQPALCDLFGEYSYNFASNVASLITTSVSYVCLFLLAIACKGGYRKVTFIGSFFISRAIFSFVPNLVSLIAAMIDKSELWYSGAGIVGQVIQYLIAIPVAIVIYILLNRYTVEKINKKA